MSQVEETAAIAVCLDVLRQHAVRLARAGRYEEAQGLMAAMLRTHESADLHCLLGKIYAQQGHMVEAGASFRLALRMRQDHHEAAGALAQVVNLTGRSPRSTMMRRLVVAMTGVATLLALAAYELVQREHPADTVAATSPVIIEGPVNASPVAFEPDLIDAFVAINARLEPLKANFGLKSRAVRIEAGLALAVSGPVPTKQVLERIQSLASGGIAVDTGGLHIEPRYRVRPRDTLASVAQAVYGDVRGWSQIWELNREILSEPGLIRPGQELLIPAWP